MVSEHFFLEDGHKTKEQLLDEITELRQQVKALDHLVSSKSEGLSCPSVTSWAHWTQSQLERHSQTREQPDLNTWRILLLQQLTASLARALTTAEIFEILLNQGSIALNANRGWVAQRGTDPEVVEIVRSIGYQPEEIEPYRKMALKASLPATDVIRTGQTILIQSPQIYYECYPDLADKFIPTGTQALVALPLIVGEQVMGCLGWSFTKPQDFDETDYSFMLTLARQCAQALERAYLYEAERLARETAEAANRVKDEFLAVLSHELRSPLNPILGWTKMLRSRRFDARTTERAFDAIERNAKLQIQLIEDLLDVSHILQGKLRLNTSRVNLISIIQATFETVKLAADSKSIQLEFLPLSHAASHRVDVDATDSGGERSVKPVKLDCCAPVYIIGDPARLQQVFWNLVSNAVKFTPTGGRVEVSLSVTQASAPQDKTTYAEVQVSDTGQGIAPVFLPYIFDYFRQADSTITRQFGGLGLGLTIVRHLIELHGGSIQAASEGEGQGTTFYITLPLLKPTLQKTPATLPLPLPPALTRRLCQTRILVVDDDPDMREFVEVVLREAGAQVALASSAGEALAKLSRFKPDVLLSDIGMPNVDGYQLLKQIRTLVPELGGQVPAIALTAYANEYNQQQILAAGFQQHLSKPLEPEQLVLTVARLLNQSAPQSAPVEAEQKLT